jgi:poly(3-hydroxybutyrate) depolymerase
MVWFGGLNKKADEAGFIVVYPSGTGTGPILGWIAGQK